MGLSNLKDFVGTSASICTILQLLVPIWICRKYIQQGNTGETSSLPFAIGLLSSSLWLLYGILQKEASLMVVNSIGVILQIGYLAVFWKNTEEKKYVYYQLGSILSVLVLVFIYVALDTFPERRLNRVGFICCVITIAFFAAPLSQLQSVIKNKSAESLPLQLIAMTFVSSALWLIYGLIIRDRFVQIPNVLGTMLSAAQLSLFVLYPPSGGGGGIHLI